MVPLFENGKDAFNYYLWNGVCHFYENRHHTALVHFEKASELNITSQLCVNMILTNEKLGNNDNVIRWCEKSLEKEFNMAIVIKILGIVQKKSYFDRCKWGRYLLSLWNDDLHNADWMNCFLAHGNMIVTDYMLVMKHEESIKLMTDLIQKSFAFATLIKSNLKERNMLRTNIEKLFSNLFLNNNYFQTNNPEIFRFVQYFMENLPKTTDIPAPKKFKPIESGRKIRIGFLSGDIVYHPVSYILNGIVQSLDKEKFESFLFSTSGEDRKNQMQNRIRESVTKMIDLPAKSTDVYEAIVKEDIDVLIEMCGHTTNGTENVAVLRAKPARVVTQYFAYPNTYGIPEIDYKIGDETVFPFGLDRYYVEKFCKIEGGMHTYKPIVDLRVIHKEHKGIVFGSTNNPKKYRPDWVKSVARILKGVENSSLKLRYFNLDDPSIREFYWKEFERHGIERSRIDLGLGGNLSEYFSSYADMDICLDTFPYNGGTINIETLYASLPYITLLGNNYVSRVGASILHQVGHPELIAKSIDEYVSKAIALANDSERLATYKRTLRDETEKTSLLDNSIFTRNFENGLLWMLKEKSWLPSAE
jgi:predicted O-linked N-acetylglucosamine transferase (SPINDLY family)